MSQAIINDVVIREDNGVKKHIGRFDVTNNIFTTTRDITKHLLRKYDAWALDKKVVEELLVPYDALIRIKANDGITYEIKAVTFKEKAKEIRFHEHRSQLYVSRAYFHRIKKLRVN